MAKKKSKMADPFADAGAKDKEGMLPGDEKKKKATKKKGKKKTGKAAKAKVAKAEEPTASAPSGLSEEELHNTLTTIAQEVLAGEASNLQKSLEEKLSKFGSQQEAQFEALKNEVLDNLEAVNDAQVANRKTFGDRFKEIEIQITEKLDTFSGSDTSGLEERFASLEEKLQEVLESPQEGDEQGIEDLKAQLSQVEEQLLGILENLEAADEETELPDISEKLTTLENSLLEKFQGANSEHTEIVSELQERLGELEKQSSKGLEAIEKIEIPDVEGLYERFETLEISFGEKLENISTQDTFDQGPLEEKLAELESTFAEKLNAIIIPEMPDLSTLEEKVTELETQLSEGFEGIVEPEPVDLEPVQKRFEELEAKVNQALELLSNAETVDLEPLNERFSQLEQGVSEKLENIPSVDNSELEERLAKIETDIHGKLDGLQEVLESDGLEERLSKLEALNERIETAVATREPTDIQALEKQFSELETRLAKRIEQSEVSTSGSSGTGVKEHMRALSYQSDRREYLWLLPKAFTIAFLACIASVMLAYVPQHFIAKASKWTLFTLQFVSAAIAAAGLCGVAILFFRRPILEERLRDFEEGMMLPTVLLPAGPPAFNFMISCLGVLSLYMGLKILFILFS